ncbi:hypothetical protein F5888DRAFT_1750906 [Russula emetica]|nr:hypothetical protein F5888DRAFT_1750906 [Russula emetica]
MLEVLARTLFVAVAASHRVRFILLRAVVRHVLEKKRLHDAAREVKEQYVQKYSTTRGGTSGGGGTPRLGLGRELPVRNQQLLPFIFLLLLLEKDREQKKRRLETSFWQFR